MSSTQQPQLEYIITEEQLSRIEKRFIPGEYGLRIIKDIRTHPHTPAPTDEQCRICSEATARAATLATLDEFQVVEQMHDVEDVSYPDLYNEFIKIYKSLRTAQEHP